MNGEVMLAPSSLVSTGVKVAPEAEKYSQAVKEAFSHPGKSVAVEYKDVFTVTDMFRYRVDTLSTLGVQYDSQKSTINAVISSEITKTVMIFSPFFIYWLVSVVAFFVVPKMKNPFVAAAAIAAAAFASGAAIAIGSYAAAAASAFAAIATASAFAIAVAASAPESSWKEIPKSLIKSYYLLMILAAGLMYYPLFI